MIKQEFINGLIKTYAEKDGVRYKIHKVGTEEYYDEAIDLLNGDRILKNLPPYTYEETDILVEEEKEETINE